MSKASVKQYVEGMTIIAQQPHSRLGTFIPRDVRCKGCNGGTSVVGSSYKDICEPCGGTGRVPIPWAEVMNVR